MSLSGLGIQQVITAGGLPAARPSPGLQFVFGGGTTTGTIVSSGGFRSSHGKRRGERYCRHWPGTLDISSKARRATRSSAMAALNGFSPVASQGHRHQRRRNDFTGGVIEITIVSSGGVENTSPAASRTTIVAGAPKHLLRRLRGASSSAAAAS